MNASATPRPHPPVPVPGPSPAAAALAASTAPPGPTDLEVKAAAARRMRLYMAAPCLAHGAEPGEPCWSVTGDRPADRHAAICGLRVAAVRRALERKDHR